MINGLEAAEVIDTTVRLVAFGSSDGRKRALRERADQRLAFQLTCSLMERYAYPPPDVAQPSPRENYRVVQYTQQAFRGRMLLVRETALRVAARVLLLNSRLGVVQHLDILTTHPQILNRLLKVASRPRDKNAPHSESDFLAMLILNLLLKAPAPFGYPMWTPADHGDLFLSEKQVFNSILTIVCNNKTNLEMLVSIYEKTQTEADQPMDHVFQ